MFVGFCIYGATSKLMYKLCGYYAILLKLGYTWYWGKISSELDVEALNFDKRVFAAGYNKETY